MGLLDQQRCKAMVSGLGVVVCRGGSALDICLTASYGDERRRVSVPNLEVYGNLPEYPLTLNEVKDEIKETALVASAIYLFCMLVHVAPKLPGMCDAFRRLNTPIVETPLDTQSARAVRL
jgi:hypothetical protein